MAQFSPSLRTFRGIQQSFLADMVSYQAPAAPEPKGAVFTKPWVVRLLLDLAGYTPTANLIDLLAVEPAAGDGAFLGEMIERLAECCGRLGRSISECRESLIAYELDEPSARRARALAVDTLLRSGTSPTVAEELAYSWVRRADFLLNPIDLKADFIIGNPPYVRLEEIPVSTAVLYRDAYKTMCGRADLYVAFFEAALSHLNENGTCAFICADRWMRNQYGTELRALITSQFSVDVIVEMHNADAFHDEVDAYPAITIIRRKEQGPVVVASASCEIENLRSKDVAKALLESNRRGSPVPDGMRSARVHKWFKGRDPWPCESPHQLALLRRIEEEFPPLETFAKVGIGVATGNDKVFITKNPDLVEPSRLLKLALARDVCGGEMRWSGNYLVDPWTDEGLVKLEEYPQLNAYLSAHSNELKARHTAVKNARGWYKTIDRVTHSLTGKRKLYIADIKNLFDPVLDEGETYPHHNLYFVESSDWDLEILGGFLLSAIGQFFIESYGVRMRGGYLRFQAQYLRRIRVPDPKTISLARGRDLIRAFRNRDRDAATDAALLAYGIDRSEMESAIGH